MLNENEEIIKLIEKFGMSAYERHRVIAEDIEDEEFDMSLVDGVIEFENGQRFSVQLLGTYAHDTETFMYGWANSSFQLPEDKLTLSNKLREYFNDKDLDDFTDGEFEIDEIDLELMGLIAVEFFNCKAYHLADYGAGIALLVFPNETEIAVDHTVDTQEKLENVFSTIEDFYDEYCGILNCKVAFENYMKIKDFAVTEQESSLVAKNNHYKIIVDLDEDGEFDELRDLYEYNDLEAPDSSYENDDDYEDDDDDDDDVEVNDIYENEVIIQLLEKFGIAAWQQYQSVFKDILCYFDIDFENGMINFENGISYPFQLLGTYFYHSEETQNGWANQFLPIPNTGSQYTIAKELRNYFLENGLDELAEAEFYTDEDDFHLVLNILGLLAIGILGHESYYIMEFGSGSAVIVFPKPEDFQINHEVVEIEQYIDVVSTTQSFFNEYGHLVNNKVAFKNFMDVKGFKVTEEGNNLNAVNDKYKILVEFDEDDNPINVEPGIIE